MPVELHRGRIAKNPRVVEVRPLTREDLAVLREPREGMPRIKKLRRIHHMVARLFATGYSDQEIVELTDYSPTRVIQLRHDPAMQELVATFESANLERIDSKIDTVQREMVSIKMRTLSLVQDYLDDVEASDDPVPIKTILPIVTEMADRTGHGKHSTSTNVSV